jgi:hypothetical protein
MRRFLWLSLCMLAGGCGGKIVETAAIAEPAPADDDANGDPRFEPVPTTPVPTPPATNPTPTSVTPLDACQVLCERDARCDTTLPALPMREGETGDCHTRCETRLRERCGIDDWLLCYAALIDTNACTPLPAECRPAFCAWATCAKQPVSNCK